MLEAEPRQDADSFVLCQLPLGYVGQQLELKLVAPSKVCVVPCAPQENVYGHQKAKLAWRGRLFLSGFQGHTSIHSPEGNRASIFLSQTEQQTSLSQLGVENGKQ